MVHLCPIDQLSLEVVKAFVYQNEIYGIQLAERLEQFSLSQDKSNFMGSFFCLIEDQILWGVIFISKAGLVLSCMPQNLPEAVFQQGIPLVAAAFKDRKVYCVSGWSRGVQLIKAALSQYEDLGSDINKRSIIEQRRYNFMCYQGSRSRREFINQQPVVRCEQEDLEELYLLQSIYDTVEVLPKNYPFKPALCRSNLQRVLALGNVMGIPEGGASSKAGTRSFMAKATVSALSWRFLLIGGVFTKDEHRGKGCAARLVQWMGDEAAKIQRQAVLFVREENLAARHSYENAGYFFSGNYEILYFDS